MRPKRHVRSIFQRFQDDHTPSLGSQTLQANSDRNDNHGVLSIMEHLNGATVRNQADLVTTTCDLTEKIRKLDQRLSSKIHDATTRQEILEILFEQQESDLEYMKETMRFTLNSIIYLYNGAISMASMNGSASSIMALANYVPPEVVQEHPEQEQQLQSPISTAVPANDHDHDDQWTTNNTVATNAIVTPPKDNNDVKLFQMPPRFKCEFCQRSFTTERNLKLHIDRMPKVCMLKRARAHRVPTGRGRKGKGFYYDLGL